MEKQAISYKKIFNALAKREQTLKQLSKNVAGFRKPEEKLSYILQNKTKRQIDNIIDSKIVNDDVIRSVGSVTSIKNNKIPSVGTLKKGVEEINNLKKLLQMKNSVGSGKIKEIPGKHSRDRLEEVINAIKDNYNVGHYSWGHKQ